MENQRNLFTISLIAISALLYFKWLDFVKPDAAQQVPTSIEQSANTNGVPSVPNASTLSSATNSGVPSIQNATTNTLSTVSELITVTTDLVVATIDTKGGVIHRLELIKEPVSLDTPDKGFPLLKETANETFIINDGLLLTGSDNSPHHQQAFYQGDAKTYDLGSSDKVTVPLTWTNADGQTFIKRITFHRDSYLIDISYEIQNNSSIVLTANQYAQFERTEPQSSGSFAQLPSYAGGAMYEKENKYQKIAFDEMDDKEVSEKLKTIFDDGWVSMMQHYFVGVFIPAEGKRSYFTSVDTQQTPPLYRIGYRTKAPLVLQPGETGVMSNQVFLGPKEQSRLNKIEEERKIEGLAFTLDYGVFTVISKPLFWLLDFVHNLVGNWGWSIVITTFLLKLLFYPLSAKSYKSMAAMKKLQPRMATLKERHKDDRQKFQMEMMAMYKKEKVNPAGGCLPILIQIPVFLGFYWAILESVEMRHAPFMLWLQDLSAPDPYYVLPILMGLTQFLMTKLNPAPMDEIQKKVMMIMPLVLTFIFVSFPQGLVLYWVVNNILTMAQQWHINRKYA